MDMRILAKQMPMTSEMPADVLLPAALRTRFTDQVRIPSIVPIRKMDSITDFQETLHVVCRASSEKRQDASISGIGQDSDITKVVIWHFTDQNEAMTCCLSTVVGFGALKLRDSPVVQAFLS